VSPSEQAERIRTACDRDGLQLIETIEELDVSGGTPLERRPGLRRAVELAEAGEADVIVAAYFDRLVRSLAVQAELVGRVEAAGGAILAVDVGQVTDASAGQWLSGTMLGAVSEYARRVTSERTADAKRRAIARGVPTFPNIPPGYRLVREGNDVIGLEPDGRKADAVRKAFEMRANGATVMQVRAFLKSRRIERSFHGVQAMLGSRVYLGELHFGALANTDSHPAIVDPATWTSVQHMRSPRGRRPKSERLLARLGVLRCGSCGARMVIGSTRQQGKAYAFYRCPPVGDCTQRVTISADIAEQTVVAAVQELLEGVTGTATLDAGIASLQKDLERIEAELAAAVQAFSGLDDVDAVRERLTELRDERDRARDRLDELTATVMPAVTLTARDWDVLTVDERRALIRAVVERAVVSPGRGHDRIRVEPRLGAT
jgi:site-specific DNA recombinase